MDTRKIGSAFLIIVVDALIGGLVALAVGALFLGLNGCSADGLATGTDPAATNPPPVTTQSAQVCATDGSFGFRVHSVRFAAYEGDVVTAAALEPHQDAGTVTLRRPVRISAPVRGAAFDLSCPSALQESFWYPSYALFVDVDHDGRCSGGDVGLEMQLYGWDQSIDDTVGQTFEWAQVVPVAQLHGADAVGADPGSFCDAYFP